MKKTQVMRLTIWTLVISTITLFTNSSQVYAQCDAEFVKALRTEHMEVTSDDIGIALYQASCTSKSEGRTTKLNIASSKYGNLDYGDSRSSLANACSEKDYEYFRRSKRDLTVTALPPSALDLLSNCLGGLTLRVRKVGRVLDIFASYRTQDGADTPAFVDNLTVKPESAVRCSTNDVFPKGLKMKSGGHVLGCEILNDDEDISVFLNTTGPSKTVWVKREPKIETVRYKWTIRRLPDLYYNCLNDGEIFGVAKYIDPTMRNQGRVNPNLLAGSCLVLHGKGTIKVDGGNSQTLKDIWGIKQIPRRKPVFFQCTLNNEVIDTVAHDCRRENTCKSETSMAYYCAGQYGLNY